MEKEDLREFVGRVPWAHLVTLASNDPTVRIDRMHERLKNWDQRVNRRMLGSAYWRKPPERVLWMAFLETPKSNPHWHLVPQLTEE